MNNHEDRNRNLALKIMNQLTIIEAGSPIQYFRRLKECWRYLDLLRMLSYRDVRVRYAQTYLGLTWAVINPVISVLLLYFVFGVVVKVDTQGIPPLAFTMAGLYSWNYFSRVVGEAGGSIIGSQSLVKKIYFPRLIIPVSKAISAIMDMGIVFLLLIGMIIVYHLPLRWHMLFIIPISILTILSCVAFGVWVASLTIRFRDFGHILPLILRIGMFLSPIAYGSSLVPHAYRLAFNLNPLTGIIESFRWALFDSPFDPLAIWLSILITMITLVGGIWYFLRMDQYIADII